MPIRLTQLPQHVDDCALAKICAHVAFQLYCNKIAGPGQLAALPLPQYAGKAELTG